MLHYSHEKVYIAAFLLSLSIFLFNSINQGLIAFNYSDTYGLLSKMNVFYWVGYAAMIFTIFYQFVHFNRLDRRYVFLTVILLVMYLIATPLFYEELPRFQDTWGHSLFAQNIYDTGSVGNTGNIYENYPGSFMFYGLLLKILPNLYVMKFLPFLLYIFGTITIFLAVRNIANEKIAFLIVILYTFFSWTVEDNHISPQSLMLNLYFLFIFLTTKTSFGGKNRMQYIASASLLFLAMVFSHVFTPVFIILILLSTFILCKRLRKWMLPVTIIFIAIFAVHEAYVGTTLNSLVTYMENFRNIFSLDLIYNYASNRFAGVEILSRQLSIGSRLAILGLSVAAGLLGMALMRKMKRKTFSNFIFAWSFSLIPFLIFMLLVMKGEFIERFALVSALPLAIAGAYFFLNRKPQILILIFLLCMTPLYFMGKYGNESFESQSIQKIKTDCFVNSFDSNCDTEFKIINSPLDYNTENIGKTDFSITREEVVSMYMYRGYGSSGDVLNAIETIENENMLNRVYSTNDAWSYTIG